MKKHANKEPSLLTLLLLGALFCLLITVAVSLVFTVISSFSKDPTSLTGIFSLLSIFVSGGVSGFVISRFIKDGGQLIAFISAAIAVLVMSVIGLIVKGGIVPISVFLNYLAYLGIVALFAFLGKNRGRKKKSYR